MNTQAKPTAAPRRPRYDGPFQRLSGPVRRRIQEAFGDEVTGDLRFDPPWGIECATIAADAILEHFHDNIGSQASTLTCLRTCLAMLEAPAEIVAATMRPKVTTAVNEKNNRRRLERAAEGEDIPESFTRVADLRERVRGYLDGTIPITCGQGMADVTVALSARPGEVERLTIGPDGGVKGMLKKRGAEDHYNLTSAIGVDDATALLKMWRDISKADRKRAGRELTTLVGDWGITRASLRGVGAFLAERACVLDGDVSNASQSREVKVKALRHSESRPAPVDFYGRNNDPTHMMAARFAEMSLSGRQAVLDLMDSLDAEASRCFKGITPQDVFDPTDTPDGMLADPIEGGSREPQPSTSGAEAPPPAEE